MHDNTALTEARIDRFFRERILPSVYQTRMPLTIDAWDAPGEPVPFAVARASRFEPFAPGTAWGRPWGTTWFRLRGRIPTEWPVPGTRVEVLVNLGVSTETPGFQAEGLVYAPDGRIIKGIEPYNDHVALEARGGDEIELYVEAASNPNLIGNGYAPTVLGSPGTSGTAPQYVFRHADVALRSEEAWALEQDMRTLIELMRELDPASPRRALILRSLERALNVLDPDDPAATAALGRAELAGVLASPAHASAHRMIAVGHAHIDSAWLWPVRETIRKCARTFSNVLDLMEHDPSFVFACSSAQQFAWMKQHYPSLFERIRERVREGRFVPVGGMWVEADTNLPGGEAMARQFVTGKGFFLREFGFEPLEAWLPDSFGYSGAMPQIVREAGSRFFLTQKLSWNETNPMPHHTFRWEGIDGTSVFTHFPPVDTYNSRIAGAELARAERQYAEKGAANLSLVPFGWGDGGGGPTREMLAAATRTANLEGSPRVRLDTPGAFFEQAEQEYPDPPTWVGELYLELHRGTYTTQARTKRGNRRSEHLLREAELWAATAAVRQGAEYPYEQLREAWETVLLQQFHDILPGSSISWVHEVAEQNYLRVAESLESLIECSTRALTGPGTMSFAFNASPYPVSGVPPLSAAREVKQLPARVEQKPGGWTLDNGLLVALIDDHGLVRSLRDNNTGREVVPLGSAANLLQVFVDLPNQWDAWDIDESYQQNRTDLIDAVEVTAATGSSGSVGVRVVREFGSSRIEQLITLGRGTRSLEFVTTIDWHERQKLLKLAIAIDVHADRAASEIQFGHIFRPLHTNTSWDNARFETSAHRWIHVGEPGYGVAVANDCTYGRDITAVPGEQGGRTVQVRETLLRAPLFPDPEADQGRHVMRTSIVPDAGILDAVREGYRLNLPLRIVPGGTPVDPLITVQSPAVVVEAVKLAEDGSGDLVVRLYEASGSRATTEVTPGFAYRSAIRTDLLERPSGAPNQLSPGSNGSLTLTLRPFQIVTLRFDRSLPKA